MFFTTLPVIASPFYLKLLAVISKTFENGEILPFVLAASDAKTLWKELNKATRVAVKNMYQTSLTLLSINVILIYI